MTNKKLYCEDVLQMLFADSDSEGEYLQFGNDDWLSIACASPGTWCRRAWRECSQSTKKWSFLPFAQQWCDGIGWDGMGLGGRGGRGLSVHRRGLALLMIMPFFLIVHTQTAGRQYRCSQCWVALGLCTVPCNKRYHTLKNYKRSPRYLIGQIAGQLIKK